MGDPSSTNVGRLVVAVMFIVTALVAVLLAIGTTLGLVVVLSQPEMHPSRAVAAPLVLLIDGGLTAFFAMVSKRLWATWRGREVPHVLPPILAIPLALALGVGGVLAVVFTHAYSAGAGAASVTFLFYGVTTLRAYWERSRGRG